MTLDKLSDAGTGVIRKVRGHGSRRLRLLELGLTPGTQVTALGRAPFGDPMRLLARGCVLTLRRTDAQQIELEARQWS